MGDLAWGHGTPMMQRSVHQQRPPGESAKPFLKSVHFSKEGRESEASSVGVCLGPSVFVDVKYVIVAPQMTELSMSSQLLKLQRLYQ